MKILVKEKDVPSQTAMSEGDVVEVIVFPRSNYSAATIQPTLIDVLIVSQCQAANGLQELSMEEPAAVRPLVDNMVSFLATEINMDTVEA